MLGVFLQVESELNPLSPEVISRQATINIGELMCTSLKGCTSINAHHMDSRMFSGTIGHVAHGKSTVVKAISGVQVCYV